MSFEILLHPGVATDYEVAYTWYENSAEGLGERFMAAVREKIIAISQHPTHYGAKHKKGYREVKVPKFPFVIVYKLYPQKKVVFVSAVIHSRMRLSARYRK